MKLKFALLILLIFNLPLFGQSAENRYHSRMTQDGVLFFIMPQKLHDLQGMKKFEYDMTLLNWTDSATINFTFESNSISIPTGLTIKNNTESIVCRSYSPLFIDLKKNHYEIRITAKFSINEVDSFIESTTPPRFCFMQDNQLMSASYRAGAWKKDRIKLQKIFQLYKYSK